MSENSEESVPKKGERRALSDAELDVAFDGPAISANRTLITIGPPGVRLAFVEQGHVSTHFRTAVTLSHTEAIALKNLLTGMLRDIEKKLKEAEEGG